MYNIFNIRKWMQGVVFFYFFCSYENKLRNRGAVLRGDEVEKELHNGGSKQGDVSEETSLYSSVFRAYAFHLSRNIRSSYPGCIIKS